MLSATQIQTYLYCKRAYYYAYVKKIKGRESTSLKKGQLFHKRIADYLSGNTDRLRIPRKWKSSYEYIIDYIDYPIEIEKTLYGKIFSLDAIGIIDLLSPTSKTIIDWKISNYQRGYPVQAFFYKELVKQNYDIDCDIAFVYLPLNKVDFVDDNVVSEGKKIVYNVLKQISSGQRLNSCKFSKNAKCFACSYSMICMAESKLDG